MAKQYTVSARLEAKDRASREIDRVQGRFARLGSFLQRNWVRILGGATAALAAFTAGMTSAIRAANQQEEAVARLDAALAPLGPRAREVSAALQEQASALQSTTRFGDEAIIQAQALLATLGVQADQLPRATEATVNLAAAFGQDLDQAARNVGRTVGGMAGELGELIPELRDLSAEALRSGEGIELLASKFSGRAIADAQTFAAAMERVGNALSDSQENIGKSVTSSEDLTKALNVLAFNIEQVNKGASDTPGILASFSTFFVDLASVIVGVGFGAFADDVGKTTDAFLAAQARAEQVDRALGLLRGTIEASSDAERRQVQNLRTLAQAYGSARAGVDAYLDAQERNARVTNEAAGAQDRLEAALGAAGIKYRDFAAELGAAEAALREVERQERARLITQEQAVFFTERLQQRILGIRQEMRGEAEDARAAAAATGALGDAAAGATDSIGAAADQVEALGGRAEATRGRLSALAAEAVRTGAAFDQLAARAGRAQAVQAAVAGGGRLILGGTRVELPGGGSRLTSTPGGVKSRVRPDGSREFL